MALVHTRIRRHQSSQAYRKEFGPGGDPDQAFHAGAIFAYRDAVLRMGECLINPGDFEAWLNAIGFLPDTHKLMREEFLKAYERQ
jgi:hypothetical protein